MKDEQTELLRLEEHLANARGGEDAALSAVAQRLRCIQSRPDARKRPQGVFLLVGPGAAPQRPETALALADVLPAVKNP